jgi:hypothetical protein
MSLGASRAVQKFELLIIQYHDQLIRAFQSSCVAEGSILSEEMTHISKKGKQTRRKEKAYTSVVMASWVVSCDGRERSAGLRRRREGRARRPLAGGKVSIKRKLRLRGAFRTGFRKRSNAHVIRDERASGVLLYAVSRPSPWVGATATTVYYSILYCITFFALPPSFQFLPQVVFVDHALPSAMYMSASMNPHHRLSVFSRWIELTL